ncbi:MAG: ATP-binding protein [Candidatus Paceibacterota bacterium]|jgi:signal transduction histidine kinase
MNNKFFQPEIRPIFYIIPLVILEIIIGAAYLPSSWMWISVAILVVLSVLIILSSLAVLKMNKSIKSEKLHMESIISHLPIGILAYDSNFKVLIFNPAASEIFSINKDEIISKKISTEMAGNPKFRVLAQVVFSSLAPTVIKRSEPGAYPQVIDVSFDDPQLELRVVTDRIFDDKGNTTGFIKLITNRTREIELIKSKTEFITVAAHQLRTPLTAVNWAFEALEGGVSLPKEQKELVDTGFMAVKKMLKTVNDLLDVSKIEEGKFGYQFEDVNVVSFLEDILSQTNGMAKQFGIKLYFERPVDTNMKVFIDGQKVSMVLYNLLDNAIKYNVENGEVTISVEKEKDEPFIKVSIKDTGIGIPTDQMDKLFTKFFRADNVVKYAPDGTGLGLYIVRNVINRHGGRIWVESELNRGTTFHFTLPTSRDVIPKKDIIEFE